MGKCENALSQHFLLFPQCFLPITKRVSVFIHIYFVVCKCFEFGSVFKFVVWQRVMVHSFCRLQVLSIWTTLKTCRLVKSLLNLQTYNENGSCLIAAKSLNVSTHLSVCCPFRICMAVFTVFVRLLPGIN